MIRPRTPDHPDYRGLAGRIATGTVSVGDEVVALPSGLRSTVAAIDSPTGPLETAGPGASVTLQLTDELDIGRGEVLAAVAGAPRTVSEIDGVACWLADSPSRPGQRVLVKTGTSVVRALLTAVGDHWDVDRQVWAESTSSAATTNSLGLNDIAKINLRLAAPVAVDDYVDGRATGGFLIIDQDSGATLAAGLVGNPLPGTESCPEPTEATDDLHTPGP